MAETPDSPDLSVPSVVTEEMRGTLGVEEPPVRFEVTSTGCRLFAQAVGHTDLVFYDADVARARGYRDLLAPPGFLGRPVFRPTDGDELESVLPIPYRRVLNAGTTCEYIEPVCAGDVLIARGKTVDFQERVGSIGPMLIVHHETTFTHEDDPGRVVARTRNSVIHY